MTTKYTVRKEDSMNTNRFISNAETFDSSPLKDIKFGGAIITGCRPESVGGISTKAILDTYPYSVDDWESSTYVDVYVSTCDRRSDNTRVRMHLGDIPKFIGLLQKTYDDFSALNSEVVEALKLTKDKSAD